MKKMLLGTTVVLTLALTSTPAFAATFTDAPETHKNYASIEYLAENKIVQGTGNGHFQPDRNITINELAIMIQNAFAPETKPSGPLPICFSKGWLPMYIAVKDPQSPITKGDAYTILTIVEGINVYSADGKINNLYSDYLRAMQEVGLATETDNVDDYLTRGEAAYLIHQLKEYQFQTASPELFKGMNIIQSNGQNLGMYQSVINNLPPKVLEAFKDNNWTLVIDQGEVLKLNEKNNLFANAWTSYSDKAIYVQNIASVTHEFGHFVHELVNFDTIIDSLYNLERDVFNAHYDENSYNTHEYFANYFEVLISCKNRNTLDELKELTPRTFEYFSNLDIMKGYFE